MLAIKDLNKTYSSGMQALKGISVDVPRGVFGLLGPNGAGKTTLMKIVATLLDPDSGSVDMSGLDVIHRKDDARKTFIAVYSIILVPGIIFVAAVAIFLNVLLREKYFIYAVIVGASASLFYLYRVGYKHWLYNPLLYQLWTDADLTGAGANQTTIFLHRLYCVAIAGIALGLARLMFDRELT